MNDKQKLEHLIDKMLANNKKQIQKAENMGDLTRMYFHEGSISALEAIRIEIEK